jgi:hypothetical protein
MKAQIVRNTSALQKLSAFVVALIVTMSIMLSAAQPAAAAYPCCVNVQAGAAARMSAGGPIANLGAFAGWVTPDQFLGRTSNVQKSYVYCYADGAWATGNYSSNRWFQVYVHLSNGKLGRFFVHSSYVYNQISVPRC